MAKIATPRAVLFVNGDIAGRVAAVSATGHALAVALARDTTRWFTLDVGGAGVVCETLRVHANGNRDVALVASASQAFEDSPDDLMPLACVANLPLSAARAIIAFLGNQTNDSSFRNRNRNLPFALELLNAEKNARQSLSNSSHYPRVLNIDAVECLRILPPWPLRVHPASSPNPLAPVPQQQHLQQQLQQQQHHINLNHQLQQRRQSAPFSVPSQPQPHQQLQLQQQLQLPEQSLARKLSLQHPQLAQMPQTDRQQQHQQHFYNHNLFNQDPKTSSSQLLLPPSAATTLASNPILGTSPTTPPFTNPNAAIAITAADLLPAPAVQFQETGSSKSVYMATVNIAAAQTTTSFGSGHVNYTVVNSRKRARGSDASSSSSINAVESLDTTIHTSGFNGSSSGSGGGGGRIAATTMIAGIDETGANSNGGKKRREVGAGSGRKSGVSSGKTAARVAAAAAAAAAAVSAGNSSANGNISGGGVNNSELGEVDVGGRAQMFVPPQSHQRTLLSVASGATVSSISVDSLMDSAGEGFDETVAETRNTAKTTNLTTAISANTAAIRREDDNEEGGVGEEDGDEDNEEEEVAVDYEEDDEEDEVERGEIMREDNEEEGDDEEEEVETGNQSVALPPPLVTITAVTATTMKGNSSSRRENRKNQRAKSVKNSNSISGNNASEITSGGLEMNDSDAFMVKQADDSGPKRRCASCGATTTPMWRKGPQGAATLCNACGVKWRKKA
ncbi:hypothetical protein HK100_003419 [Physocladia obscura]|uniref:GATA-type domain-containing protein n=1 Tax=Physocladia obscura TaxID=109957 RepID=A0AAD5XEL6_9FUNG|nr:hypothetical protein HK100_003419 [Physocladia obscura]